MAISAEVLGAVDDAHEGAEGNRHDRVARREYSYSSEKRGIRAGTACS